MYQYYYATTNTTINATVLLPTITTSITGDSIELIFFRRAVSAHLDGNVCVAGGRLASDRTRL